MQLDTNTEKASVYSLQYDIVFVAALLIGEDGEYFSGGAEIHLRSVIDAVKKDKKVAVIQYGRKTDWCAERDGVTFITLAARSTWLFRWRVRKVLNRLKTPKVYFNYLGLEALVQKKPDTRYIGVTHGIGWDFPTRGLPEP